jgi:hypothetical protein
MVLSRAIGREQVRRTLDSSHRKNCGQMLRLFTLHVHLDMRLTSEKLNAQFVVSAPLYVE